MGVPQGKGAAAAVRYNQNLFNIAVLDDTAFTPQGGSMGIMNSKAGTEIRQTAWELDNVFPTLSTSYFHVVVRYLANFCLLIKHYP